MSTRVAALRARFAALSGELARVDYGVVELDQLFRDLIRAYAPPNVQYERERIIAQLSNSREIAFVLGLLSEGENEAALVLELVRAAGTVPHAEIAHLVDEAWYYLRTSIDENWQLDDGPPSATAALVYLHVVLTERLEALETFPAVKPLAATMSPGRAALLRSLRDELAIGRTGS